MSLFCFLKGSHKIQVCWEFAGPLDSPGRSFFNGYLWLRIGFCMLPWLWGSLLFFKIAISIVLFYVYLRKGRQPGVFVACYLAIITPESCCPQLLVLYKRLRPREVSISEACASQPWLFHSRIDFNFLMVALLFFNFV